MNELNIFQSIPSPFHFEGEGTGGTTINQTPPKEVQLLFTPIFFFPAAPQEIILHGGGRLC